MRVAYFGGKSANWATFESVTGKNLGAKMSYVLMADNVILMDKPNQTTVWLRQGIY